MSGPLGIDWDAQPLGVLNDHQIARRVGCTPAAVFIARKARGIPSARKISKPIDRRSISSMLGEYTDAYIAAKAGATRHQVFEARREAGIPAKRFDWSTELLAKVPDRVIAEASGVKPAAIAHARKRRGLGRWSEKRQCPCGNWMIAYRMRERFCSRACSKYHWMLVNDRAMDAKIADVHLALWRLKKTAKGKRHGLAKLS